MAGEDLYGKKVYFLSPSYTIRTEIIQKLREMEFEVYIIDKFRYAKNILRHNPNSVFFISLDTALTVQGWYMYIKSFQDDFVLQNVALGILVSRLTAEEKSLFLDQGDLELKAGIVEYNKDRSKLFNEISDILLLNNAKGRRQSVRANCLQDKRALFTWATDSIMYQVKMVDISAAGAALMIPAKHKIILQEKTVIHNATVILGNKQLTLSFLVYAIYQKGENQLVVTLFMPDTATGIKRSIRDYVFQTLQQQMELSINGEPKDNHDYAEDGRNFQEQLKANAEVRRKEEQEKQKEQ